MERKVSTNKFRISCHSATNQGKEKMMILNSLGITSSSSDSSLIQGVNCAHKFTVSCTTNDSTTSPRSGCTNSSAYVKFTGSSLKCSHSKTVLWQNTSLEVAHHIYWMNKRDQFTSAAVVKINIVPADEILMSITWMDGLGEMLEEEWVDRPSLANVLICCNFTRRAMKWEKINVKFNSPSSFYPIRRDVFIKEETLPIHIANWWVIETFTWIDQLQAHGAGTSEPWPRQLNCGGDGG